jgi:hypothetical protein
MIETSVIAAPDESVTIPEKDPVKACPSYFCGRENIKTNPRSNILAIFFSNF